MYNVKISEYLESTEVVFYEKPIKGHEKEKDSFIIERDNELFEVYSFMAFSSKSLEDIKQENAVHSFYTSFNRTKNKIYNYARDNVWEWFLTFTFDPKIIDSFNYDIIVKCMTDFLRYIGNHSSSKTKYLIVPERHKSGRYHLHGVFSNIDMSLWKMKYSGHTTKGGLPIYNSHSDSLPLRRFKVLSAYLIISRNTLQKICSIASKTKNATGLPETWIPENIPL